MVYFALAVAPSLAILLYIYQRDRYEKEPRGMLLKAFIYGMLIVIPCAIIELLLSFVFSGFGGFIKVLIMSFIIAALTEESLKFFILKKVFFRAKAFNERFDGIVYAVFISLGFATLENIIYVSQGDISVGIIRAFTAVPAHALFAVSMGYYLGRARFSTINSSKGLIFKALIVPIMLHGIYDFILFANNPIILLFFIPFLLYLWRRGFHNIKELDTFKDTLINENNMTHGFSEVLTEGVTIEEHMSEEHTYNRAEAELFPEDVC